MKQLTKLEIRDFPFLGKCVFVWEDLVFVDISVPDLLCKTEEDLLVLKSQWRHPKKIDFILIMCCLKGSLLLRFNLAERKLSAGDVVVLPSNNDDGI